MKSSRLNDEEQIRGRWKKLGELYKQLEQELAGDEDVDSEDGSQGEEASQTQDAQATTAQTMPTIYGRRHKG